MFHGVFWIIILDYNTAYTRLVNDLFLSSLVLPGHEISPDVATLQSDQSVQHEKIYSCLPDHSRHGCEKTDREIHVGSG